MTSVVLNADRTFVSSSLGITGALKVIVDRSETQKDSVDDRVGLTGDNTPQPFGENTYEGRRIAIMEAAALGSGNAEFEIATLLDGTGAVAGHEPPEYEKYGIEASTTTSETGYSDISMHPRNSTELLVRALKPTNSIFSSGSMALSLSERILEPYYKVQNSAIGSKFVNFNCMSFFEPSGLKPALIYRAETELNNNNVLEYIYQSRSGDFSIEFYIKLRDTLKTGTVIHYPGHFSVSVLTGSEKNASGFATNYSLGLAIGSAVTLSSADTPYNLTFGTTSQTQKSQSTIVKDYWHHCAITYKRSTGDTSIYIDGKLSSRFKHARGIATTDTYNGLIIGSYYNGSTSDLPKLTSDQIQGHGSLQQRAEDVASSNFDCHLNADIHEVRIWNKVINEKQIAQYMNTTYTGSYADHRNRGLMLYVPGLFDVDYRYLHTHVVNPEFNKYDARTKNQPSGFRFSYGNNSTPDFGTVAYTGQIAANISDLSELFDRVTPGVTKKLIAAPYNTNHANIGNFANVNIQGFLKDFANINFPHCHHLSESLGNFNSDLEVLNVYEPFYNTNADLTSSFNQTLGHQARNCFILPCDNGNFRPDYNTLFHATGSNFLSHDGFYINTKNIGDLDDLLDSRLFFIDDVFAQRGTFNSPESFENTQGADSRYNSGIDLFVIDDDQINQDILNFDQPTTAGEGGAMSDFFDTSDFPGQLTTVVTIPQLYYGRRIKPGSLKLSSHLYNNNQAQIELRDNGYGVLYRHQASGSIADWNKVGDVFYGEGLIYIRHPSLYGFSDSDMTLEFKSESQVNVFETSIPCVSAQFNSSSNPNYNKLRPSLNDNETAEDFVYISTVYLHDNNLNVVGKAKLAQPVIKRPDNKYLFRVKLDY